jgi:hypothetical protein
VLAFVASGWVILAIAIAVAPERVRAVCAKEGACELVSHVVLAVALLGFAIAVVRAKSRAHAWALGLVAIACAVVLGEELDWGAVLGLRGLADPLERGLGSANVHNAARGHSYVLFALASPVLAAVAFGRGAWARRWQDRLGPWTPRPGDGAAALLVLVVALVVALAVPGWEAEIDEAAELLGYAVMAAIAVRGHGAASGFASSTYS